MFAIGPVTQTIPDKVKNKLPGKKVGKDLPAGKWQVLVAMVETGTPKKMHSFPSTCSIALSRCPFPRNFGLTHVSDKAHC